MRRADPRREVSVRQAVRPAPLRNAVLKGLVLRALAAIPVEEADIRVRVVGEAEMARWNRDLFGRTGTTNVIAFPEEAPSSVGPARAAGDILVSAATCLAQTRGWPGSREDRVLFFVIHGLMHILGFDHETGESAARAMRTAEERLYRSVVSSRETAR